MACVGWLLEWIEWLGVLIDAPAMGVLLLWSFVCRTPNQPTSAAALSFWPYKPKAADETDSLAGSGYGVVLAFQQICPPLFAIYFCLLLSGCFIGGFDRCRAQSRLPVTSTGMPRVCSDC